MMLHDKHDQAHCAVRNALLFLLKKEEFRAGLKEDTDLCKRISKMIDGVDISMFIYSADTPASPRESPSKVRLRTKVYEFDGNGCNKKCIHDTIMQVPTGGDPSTLSITTGGVRHQIEISVEEDKPC